MVASRFALYGSFPGCKSRVNPARKSTFPTNSENGQGISGAWFALDSLHRQNQTGHEGAHLVWGEACLLEEPTCSNCEGVYVTRKLQAHACRELLSEIIVTCDLKVGIATIKVNVVN